MSDDLVQRLRGKYRIPITDGMGSAGGDEPDNAHEFVRQFPSVPIQVEAADRIAALEAALAPFAACGLALEDSNPEREIFACHVVGSDALDMRARVTVGDFFTPRAALGDGQ